LWVLANSTLGFTYWAGNAGPYATPQLLIPRACWQQELHFHSEGTIVIPSGSNLVTFRPAVGGLTPNSNNDIPVTLATGTSQWTLDTDYWDTQASSLTPHTSYGYWRRKLTVNGIPYTPAGGIVGNFPWQSNGDATFDEQVFCSGANAVINCTSARVDVISDPVDGY
jgi:hypothetical protein